MDPMTQMQQNVVAQWWKTALETQVTQMNAMLAELTKIERKGYEQAQTAIDEAARLGKAGLEASAQLQAAWRRLAENATATVGMPKL